MVEAPCSDPARDRVIVAVVGTGTGIGKTHLAVALTQALAARGPVVAWKPVESGVRGALGDDEAALAAVSAAHVPSLRLRAPLSPHLAARREGVVIEPAALHDRWLTLAETWPTLVVELAGDRLPDGDRLDATRAETGGQGHRQRREPEREQRYPPFHISLLIRTHAGTIPLHRPWRHDTT